MTTATGNEVQDKAAKAAPGSPYAKEIAERAQDLGPASDKAPVKETGTQGEVTEPKPAEAPVEEPLPVEQPVVYWSQTSDFRFWIKPADIVAVGAGLKKRDPGCCVQFDEGVAMVYPSKVYYEWNKQQIKGEEVIQILDAAPFNGNTFKRLGVDEPRKTETVNQAIGRLSMMTLDEVKAEAAKLKLKLDPELNREAIMLKIVDATCK